MMQLLLVVVTSIAAVSAIATTANADVAHPASVLRQPVPGQMGAAIRSGEWAWIDVHGQCAVVSAGLPAGVSAMFAPVLYAQEWRSDQPASFLSRPPPATQWVACCRPSDGAPQSGTLCAGAQNPTTVTLTPTLYASYGDSTSESQSVTCQPFPATCSDADGNSYDCTPPPWTETFTASWTCSGPTFASCTGGGCGSTPLPNLPPPPPPPKPPEKITVGASGLLRVTDLYAAPPIDMSTLDQYHWIAGGQPAFAVWWGAMECERQDVDTATALQFMTFAIQATPLYGGWQDHSSLMSDAAVLPSAQASPPSSLAPSGRCQLGPAEHGYSWRRAVEAGDPTATAMIQSAGPGSCWPFSGNVAYTAQLWDGTAIEDLILKPALQAGHDAPVYGLTNMNVVKTFLMDENGGQQWSGYAKVRNNLPISQNDINNLDGRVYLYSNCEMKG